MNTSPPKTSYINAELSANLDSTFAFEGPEKLLEIWLWESERDVPPHMHTRGLRSIPLEDWLSLLDLVNCKILSRKSSEKVDAYVLSESSLFVFHHKMVLKTCGTTTTLACLDKLFELINEHVCHGENILVSKSVYSIFYSRRSFMFPEKQLHVHKAWDQEVALLDEHFVNGRSLIIGEDSADDNWHLYTGGTCVGSGTNSSPVSSSSCDQTFEIIMTELDQNKVAEFLTSRKPGVESLIKEGTTESDLGHKIGLETMHETKLDRIFDGSGKTPLHLLTPSSSAECLDGKHGRAPPNVKFFHDAFSFTPCGFSSNSISDDDKGYFYTIHVTPECGWSYASFETNFCFASNPDVKIAEVLSRVIEVFGPAKFTTTLLSENIDEARDVVEQLENASTQIKMLGYDAQHHALRILDNEYHLLYSNYVRG